MNKDTRLTRSRVPIEFRDAKGKKKVLQTRALSDDDMIEIDDWLRREYMRRVEASISDLTNETLRERMVATAVRNVATLGMLDGRDGSAMVATVDGLSRILWQSMREDHEELTHQGLKRLLMADPANMTTGQEHWTEINIGKTGGGKKKRKPGKRKDLDRELRREK